MSSGRRERPPCDLQLPPPTDLAPRTLIQFISVRARASRFASFAFLYIDLSTALTRSLPKPSIDRRLQSFVELIVVFAPALLSSHPSLTTTSGPDDHHGHSSRDQCGVTCKRRLKLCALDHAASRPLAIHHHTALAQIAAACLWLPGSTRARTLFAVGDRPACTIINARAEPVIGSLPQGCKTSMCYLVFYVPCLTTTCS